MWYFLSCRDQHSSKLHSLSKSLSVNSKARCCRVLCVFYSCFSHCGTHNTPKCTQIFSRNWHSTVCLICSSCRKSFGSFTLFELSLSPNQFWFRPSAARLSGLAWHFWTLEAGTKAAVRHGATKVAQPLRGCCHPPRPAGNQWRHLLDPRAAPALSSRRPGRPGKHPRRDYPNIIAANIIVCSKEEKKS